MRTFVIFGLLSTLLVLSSADSPAEKKKMREAAIKIIAECKTSVGATDEDLGSFAKKKIPSSHEGLCLMACVFNTTKVMQNGKYSKRGVVEGFNPFIDKQNIKKHDLEVLADACEKDVGAGAKDKCQTAKLIAECFMKNAKH